MASRKVLKKNIKAVLDDLMEEAISYELYNPGKKKSDVEEIIKDLLLMYDEAIETLAQKPVNKEQIKAVREKVNTVLPDYMSRVNGLWE